MSWPAWSGCSTPSPSASRTSSRAAWRFLGLGTQATDHLGARVVRRELEESVERGQRTVRVVLAGEGDQSVEERDLDRIGRLTFLVGVQRAPAVHVVAGAQVGADEPLVRVGAVRLEGDEDLQRGCRAGEVVARRAGEVRVGEV